MYKTKRKLIKENEELKSKNDVLKQSVYELQENRKINDGLYNMVKAILKQLCLDEIEINNNELKEVDHLEIYVTDSYTKFAKRIKLVDKNKILKIDELKKGE